jgi:hypothetical protein
MSKEGNMEELERFEFELDSGDFACVNRYKDPGGEYVRFSDVQEREARLQARIEELERQAREATEGEVRAYYAFAECKKADARWRERIEGLAAEWEEAKPRFKGDAQANQLIYEFIRDLWALLLDSGEEGDCPDCGNEGEVLADGADFGRQHYMPCPTCRATPSPALHREGREDGDSALAERLEKLAGLLADEFGNYITTGNLSGDYKEGQADAYLHASQLVRESGPDPVAVPEKVEVNRDEAGRVYALVMAATKTLEMLDAVGYEDQYHGKGELRAALAAFRATEEGK